MKRLVLLLSLLLFTAGGSLCAQSASPPSGPATASIPGIPIIDRAHAGDWSSDITFGWHTHAGDNPAWAAPAFDDSAWDTVEMDDQGSARLGWRWYRLHVKLHQNHPDLALLIGGGVGTYELYVNGILVQGPHLRSSFGVNRPVERVIPLNNDGPLNVAGTDLFLALRTHAPTSYAGWRLPLFMAVNLGTPTAIDAQRQAMESDRLYTLIPAAAINLILILAGIGVFALGRSQPNHSEYRWLGLYLFLIGASGVLWYLQTSGIFPLSAGILIADPFLYLTAATQIQFTFTFGAEKPGRLWRAYQAVLLAAPLLTGITWFGFLTTNFHLAIEAILLLPAAVLLPVLLFLWYRRGNREAGWLILPSLLPAASMSLYDLGTLAIFFTWKPLEFLDNAVQLGPVPLQPSDLGNLFFLLAIAIVIFFRFTRVSREQARSAAELGAAREIQQRLVPASLPAPPGLHLESAYLPANEVGGDFYQVLEQPGEFTLIVLGDVSGKGLKAAMTGTLAIGALRTLAAENHPPGALLARLNRQILAAHDSGFITCLCLRISPQGAVTLANAGHLAPYRSGHEIPLDAGLPLGITAEVEYVETEFQLASGESLTLLSDGVVEAMNPARELYGFDRTRALSTQSAAQIAAAAQQWGQEDDITVLTIQRTA